MGLKLHNHEFKVRKTAEAGVIPRAAERDALYQELHDDHLHVVEEEEHYAVDLELVTRFLVKHKDDAAALDAIAVVLANRGVGVNVFALRGEPLGSYKDRLERAARQLEAEKRAVITLPERDGKDAEADWDAIADRIQAVIGSEGTLRRTLPASKAEHVLVQHAEDSLLKTDGPGSKHILPLDLLALSRQIGFHHDQKDRQPHPHIPHGGHMSHRALEVLDEFLAAIGLRANHVALAIQFCPNCQGTRVAALKAEPTE